MLSMSAFKAIVAGFVLGMNLMSIQADVASVAHGRHIHASSHFW